MKFLQYLDRIGIFRLLLFKHNRGYFNKNSVISLVIRQPFGKKGVS